MKPIPTAPDITPTLLFNPSKSDFTWPMADDTGKHDYILPSRQIVTFPKYLADHLAKHLAQKLASENTTTITKDGSVRLHYEERYKRELERIYVEL